MRHKASISLPLLSSCFFILTLPPFRQRWLAGIAIVPLLILIGKGRSFGKDLLSGLLPWFPYCALGLYWCLYYSVWNYFDVLVSYLPFLPLFSGLTGLCLKKFPESIPVRFLGPPMIWVTLSFLYDQTPVGGIGTQAFFYQSLEWMQSVRIFGIYGVMFLFLMLNASIALILQFRSKRRFIPFVFSILLLVANFLWGRKAMAGTFRGAQNVALIQHNLPVQKEWWLKNHRFILEQYRSLAFEAAKEKPSLIIFPSYSLPFDAYRDSEFFEQLAKEAGSYILVATYIPQEAHRRIAEVGQYEVAILFSPEGKLVAFDRSVQAPPFREIHQVLAKETEVLTTPLGRIGVLLCFEDAVPHLAKDEVKKGAELLVALSNPGHFTKTFLPEYHLFQDQLRAIETGLFVIRVTANGYSAVIDPRGRILQRSGLGKQEILYAKV